MNKHIGVCGFIVGALSLAGCGVTIEAARIDPTKAHEGEGVVYSLPRTGLSLSLPVTLVKKSGGALSDSWTECVRACQLNPTGAAPESACSYDAASVVRFGTPVVAGVSAPDLTHMYRVVVDSGYFETVSHKFVLGEDGVLSESNTTASNATYEIISSAVGTVIGLSKLKLSERKLAQQMTTNQKKDCTALEKEIDKIVSGKAGKLSCMMATQISHCLSEKEDAVKAEKDKRTKAVQAALDKKRDADSIKFIDQQGKDAIAAAEAVAAAERARFGISELSTTKIPYTYETDLGYPREFTALEVAPFDLKKRLDTAKDGPLATVSSTHEAGDKERGTLIGLLAGHTFEASIKPDVDLGYCLEKTPSPCAGVEKGGYRYRIPAKASVTSTLKKGTNEVSKTKATMPIAQYGVVAAMPSHFKGKGGKVNVKLHPAMGTLDTAELNADALPTTVVTDQIDKVKARVDARRAADPEVAALERELKILELRKKIQDVNNPAPADPAK
jgi:hypothetical protein